MMDTILHILSKDAGEKPAKQAKGEGEIAESAICLAIVTQ